MRQRQTDLEQRAALQRRADDRGRKTASQPEKTPNAEKTTDADAAATAEAEGNAKIPLESQSASEETSEPAPSEDCPGRSGLPSSPIGPRRAAPNTPAEPESKTPPPIAPAPPERLGKMDIKDVMVGLRHQVAECGNQHPGKGQVRVAVTVAPSGSVSAVNVQSTPNADLGDCVAAVVQHARFRVTQKGGKFSFPYVF